MRDSSTGSGRAVVPLVGRCARDDPVIAMTVLARSPRSSRIAHPARAPKTSPSSSELLARRFAPWTPVHATSPAAKSPGNRRSTVQIRLHAAHDVVGGRADRDAIARQVETRPPAHLRDQRKPLVNEIRIQAFERQKHRLFRCDGSREQWRATRDRAAPDRLPPHIDS